MRFVAFLLLLFLGSVSEAQPLVGTPNVPPGSFYGMSVPANWTTIAVETSPTTSLIYFSVDGIIPGTSFHPGSIYFNTRTCTAVPCNSAAWQYPTSVPVLTFPETSVSLGDVFHDANQRFFNVRDGRFYSWLMYFVVQPTSCDGVASFLGVSFSDDGEHWWYDFDLTHMLAHQAYGFTFPCYPAATNTVPATAFSAVLDTSSGVLSGARLNGKIANLRAPANFNTTQTFLDQALVSDPMTIVQLGSISGQGLWQPNAVLCSKYKYFPAVATAFEPASGQLSVSPRRCLDLGTGQDALSVQL